MKAVTGTPALAAVLAAAVLATGCTTAQTPPGAAASPGPVASSPGRVADVNPAVQRYVDAVNAGDLDALVASFAPDAEIVDVSRSIRGSDAIRVWAGREVIGGTLRVLEIVEPRRDGQKLLVQWSPGGTGGWRAHYDFTVADDRIVRADLQYAD